MKKLFLYILFSLAFQYVKAQNLGVSKVENKDLVYILNNIKILDKHVNSKYNLFINLYEVYNSSGSAGNESCEVSSDLYIAVSEDGEAPEHHLYKIKDLNSPELIKWFNSPKENEFLLSFLDKSGKKKTMRIEVYLLKIDIKIL